ncbi:hypothetical protein Bca4012_044635 [Brassica carinata]
MRKTSSPSQKPIDFEKPSKNYRKETKITIYYPLTFVTFSNLAGEIAEVVESLAGIVVSLAGLNLSRRIESLAGIVESLAGSNLSRRNVDQFGDFEI